MSTHGRKVPADMLLLRARVAPVARKQSQEQEENDLEILAPEEDALVESEGPSADERDSLLLRRPIADVHLGHIGWSGAVDHGALQSALACAPQAFGLWPGWLALAGFDRPTQAAPDVRAHPEQSAFEVRISRADLELCDALAGSGDVAFRLMAQALVLPERLVGASAPARAVVAEVLATYRRSCLAYAWSTRLDLARTEMFARERDDAAVALLSTLRAVLGER